MDKEIIGYEDTGVGTRTYYSDGTWYEVSDEGFEKDGTYTYADLGRLIHKEVKKANSGLNTASKHDRDLAAQNILNITLNTMLSYEPSHSAPKTDSKKGAYVKK